MQTFNTYFTTQTELKDFIEKNNIIDSSKILIQIFTSQNDKDFIVSLTKTIDTLLPLSFLIGTTTDGEIKDGLVTTNHTVISISIFERVELKSYISEDFSDYFEAGKNLATSLLVEDSKVIISFIDGILGNGEDFLQGINAINQNIKVSGGMAGDNATFEKTYVFTKEKVFSNGVVGVSLSSPSLNIFTDYSFNWQSIGKHLTITKAIGNRVFTIDDKTAVETYGYYLGDEVAKQLPFLGIEFPLIIQRDGLDIARAVVAKEEDGSLVFAGNFKNGDRVRFGYGNSNTILDATQGHIDKLTNIPIESIFIYSCMARRRFMPDEIENETAIYNQIATTSGFFTYGEFFSSKAKKELLNQSMTVLTLSESNNIHQNIGTIKTKELQNTTLQALSHLISVSSKELEIEKENFKYLFNNTIEAIGIFKDYKCIDVNEAGVKLLKFKTKEEMLGIHMMNLVAPDSIDVATLIHT